MQFSACTRNESDWYDGALAGGQNAQTFTVVEGDYAVHAVYIPEPVAIVGA